MLNEALIFIKPHAATDKVVALVHEQLQHHGITVVSECDVSAERIASERIVDRHYSTIARYAMDVSPEQLPLSDEARDKFAEKFGISFQAAVEQGRIANAEQARERLGGLSVPEFQQRWAGGATKVKLGPGMYAGTLAEDSTNTIVINGFYLANREKFTKPGSWVHLMAVQWPESSLPWPTFRASVIGPTNPKDAPAESIRGIIYARWEELDLPAQPDTSDNSVHASAGPLEGLAERIVWLGNTVTNDPFGKRLLEANVSPALIDAWLQNPVVTILGKSAPVFDILEDLQSEDAVAVAQQVTQAEAPASSSDAAEVPQQATTEVAQEVSEGSRTKSIPPGPDATGEPEPEAAADPQQDQDAPLPATHEVAEEDLPQQQNGAAPESSDRPKTPPAAEEVDAPLVRVASPSPTKRQLFKPTLLDQFPSINGVMDEREMRALFKSYDHDGSGYISRDEFKAQYKQFEHFGVPLSSADVDRLFNKYDTSKDGRLSFEEFALLMLQRSKH